MVNFRSRTSSISIVRYRRYLTCGTTNSRWNLQSLAARSQGAGMRRLELYYISQGIMVNKWSIRRQNSSVFVEEAFLCLEARFHSRVPWLSNSYCFATTHLEIFKISSTCFKRSFVSDRGGSVCIFRFSSNFLAKAAMPVSTPNLVGWGYVSILTKYGSDFLRALSDWCHAGIERQICSQLCLRLV